MDKGVLVREKIGSRFEGTKVQGLRVKPHARDFSTLTTAVQLRDQEQEQEAGIIGQLTPEDMAHVIVLIIN